MITSVVMRNCATYGAEGASLQSCKKVNFIYGPNGSGKSTISKFLKDPSNPLFNDCSIIWENGFVNEVMVYNRDFRNLHFAEDDIPGVFTLGRSTIEDIKHIDELRDKQERLLSNIVAFNNSLKSKREELERRTSEFRETVWETVFKKNDGVFRDAFYGLRNSKEKFCDRILREYDSKRQNPFLRADLEKRATAVYGKEKPQAVASIDFEVTRSLSEIALIERDEVWRKVVVGSSDIPISKLIQSFDNADWVNRGRQYLRSDGICPFCQQKTIDSTFRDLLDNFFSGEYEDDIKHIESIIDSYALNTRIVLEALKLVDVDVNITIGEIDRSAYRSNLGLIEALFDSNLSAMQAKLKEPGRKFEIEESCSYIDIASAIIESANKNIAKHNNLVQNYESERGKLTDDIWVFLVCEYRSLISAYISTAKNISNAQEAIARKIEVANGALEKISGEIIEAEKNVTSVQPTVDEINRLLKSYGFHNFQIVPSPKAQNKYQIQRPDGTLASETLSEGEETFVSFLYFMQLAKGAVDVTKVSSKRVLVLDDPISSLDSTILYIVSAMVKDLIKRIKEESCEVTQLFLLTHNVFFHKEASFIDGRTKEDGTVNFWIIHKDIDTSLIAAYGMKNPINTSYELLWKELRETNPISLVATQNIMRRIIENYFNMLGRGKDNSIIQSFGNVEEQRICESLFYWINDGSHTIPDDLFIDSYSDSIAKYKDIFHRVFIVTGNEAHYNMMMGIS